MTKSRLLMTGVLGLVACGFVACASAQEPGVTGKDEHGTGEHGERGPAREHGAREHGGVRVVRVAPDGPARAAGVMVGDRITKLAGKAVATRAELMAVLTEHSPGEKLTVTVVRGDGSRNLVLVVGDLAQVHGEVHAGDPYLGVGLDPGDPYPAGEFAPASFDVGRTIRLGGRPEEVFPLFDPARSAELLGIGTATVLHAPSGGARAGTVLRIARSDEARGQVVVIDAYDAEDMVIRYSILYPDVELEKFWFRFAVDPNGGTIVTVREIIMGLNAYGNDAVRQYVGKGGVEQAIDSLGEAVGRHLREAAEESRGAAKRRGARRG